MPVTISISGRFDGPTLELLDQLIADFESINPGIKVMVTQAQPDTKHTDIYILDDTALAASFAAGMIISLDEYAQTWAGDLEGFLPASRQASLFDGQMIAIPWTADGGMLYYRQDLMSGLDGKPADTHTWPALQQLALELKTRDGLAGGLVWQGAAYESLTCNTLEYVWAYGGQVLDQTGAPVFDSPETLEALQQMLAMITSSASPPEVTTHNETLSLAEFQDGQAGLMRNWSFAWKSLDDNAPVTSAVSGIAPLPTSCLFGQHLALSSASGYPDEAFRFMTFLVGHDQQVQLAQVGGLVPALESALQDAQLLSTQPVYKEYHAALLVARPRPRVVPYAEVSEAIYSEVHAMLNGEQSPEQAAARVQNRLEEILLEQ
jgi:multiple sugar transport system substrate-binding protein